MIAPEWPNEGRIVFSEVSLRYRSGQHLALDSISFQVLPGERLGIVGRTGSGKSSIVRGLFRLVQHVPYSVKESRHSVGLSGKITVDNTDISCVPLMTLRQRLGVIPQEPFLFSGSVRDNLDPQNEFSDNAVRDVLVKCHLGDLADDLHQTVGERGRLVSAGQRQLLCLARVLLKGASIVCLDEATSAVNIETEQLMQKTLVKEFSGVTFLIIAHRLQTITHFCDRVIVLQHGCIVEEGPTSQLINVRGSLLAKMLADTQNQPALTI